MRELHEEIHLIGSCERRGEIRQRRAGQATDRARFRRRKLRTVKGAQDLLRQRFVQKAGFNACGREVIELRPAAAVIGKILDKGEDQTFCERLAVRCLRRALARELC